MSFLLDTNVVSEWVRPQPNSAVITWLDEVDEDRVFLSVITLTELRYGVERLAAGKRRKRLQDWLEHELPLRFEGRVLDVDLRVAHACGELLSRREAAGRPLGAMDAFLAATAGVYRLTLATRNDSDFAGIVQCLNPWR
jgi:hypothetical protein